MKKYIFWIIIHILIASCSITFYMIQMKSKVKNPYPLVDFARSFIDQKHFIVNVSSLREKLFSIVGQHKDLQVSLYVEFLNTGSNIIINQDLDLWPASLVKLPIALAATKKVEHGIWKWDDQLVLTEDDKDLNFGSLYKEPLGSHHTIESLVGKILIDSDNTAYRMLLRNLEKIRIDDIVSELGMDRLYDDDKKIRVKDYARILRSLYVSSYLNRENSQKLLTMLTQSNVNTLASFGVPKEIPFAHKIAFNSRYMVFGDAGIVYVPHRPYLLAIMVNSSRPEQEEEAIGLIQEVSKVIYEYFATYE